MRIQLAPGTTLTNVEGKEVLFSTRTGDSFGLNETAAQMLRLALEIGTTGAATKLAGEYDAPQEELQTDLDELVDELVQLKLVVASSDQGG
jgi:hypothetical protein